MGHLNKRLRPILTQTAERGTMVIEGSPMVQIGSEIGFVAEGRRKINTTLLSMVIPRHAFNKLRIELGGKTHQPTKGKGETQLRQNASSSGYSENLGDG